MEKGKGDIIIPLPMMKREIKNPLKN